MLLGAVILALLVAAVIAVLIAATHELRESAQRGDQTDALISQANLTEKLVLDMETGQRGFVITREEDFLEPWRSAKRALPPAAAKLVRLARDDKRTLALAEQIQRESRAYEREWADPVVRLARTDSMKARELVLTRGGKRLVDLLRAKFAPLVRIADANRLHAERDANNAATRAIGIGIGGMVLSIAMVLAYAFYLARSVARPVRGVADAADRLAGGDLDARAPDGGPREVRQLASSFNQMASSLAENRAALEEERARFSGALQAATDYSIVATDLEGLITVFNVGAERMLGYAAGEMIGEKTPGAFHDPAEVVSRADELGIEPGFRVFVDAATRGESEAREWTYVRKDGSRLPVFLTVSPVRSANEEIVGFMGIASDLTERKHAEERIRALVQERDVILSSAGVGIYRVDRDDCATYVNPEAARLIGADATTLVGRRMHETIHYTRRDGSAYPPEECPIHAAIAEGMTQRVDDEVFWTLDGQSFPVDYTVAPTYGDGSITGAVTIFSDITERERAHAAAAAAQLEAERANRAKSEFLSRMSHELRTPLNAILGFGQVLELEQLTPDQDESVRHILRGGRHLLDLINEILDISRIEAGTLAISPEAVRVGDSVADAMSLVRPLADEREVRLVHELGAADDIHVLADRQRLKQVLLNLLSNAIKYNRRGGHASVLLRPDDDAKRLCIRVTDEGAGIPADRLERLFTPFDRLGAEMGEVEGTGLGLALSKRLVEVMGGALKVESHVGAGSAFVVELATTRSPDPAQAGGAIAGRPGLDLPDLPVGTLLYVEDNVANLRLVEYVLSAQDHVHLITAMQGSVGLDLARRHKPDLILLDVHLPDMGGAEVLERLKADPATHDTPVVILSADATDRQIARLLDKGAHDYLTKPLDLERLIDVIGTVLDGGSDRAS